MTHSLATYLLFLHLCNLAMGNVDPSPRMIFTEKEKAMTRFSLPHDPPVQILLEDQSDTVLTAGQSYLNTYSFQNHKTSHKFMQWEKCNSISSEHVSKINKFSWLDLIDLTVEAPMCLPSENIANLIEGIERFNIKEGEPSVFIDSEQSAAFYITHSGFDESVGIQKFGKAIVLPKNHDKEQHYVGLVLSKREEDPSQNRVYGFYREKSKDNGLFSEMWLPFVTQVCMTDVGGPKNNLQFTWTSQMNARLFCGDRNRKQHFSELVDVSTVDADRWQDTKIYALFRNECCQDCMLSRDPYCGWDGTQCIRDTNGIWHDAATGNLAICQEHAEKEFPNPEKDVVRFHAKHFLRCPVSSRHAQYSWQHLQNSASCIGKPDHCLYLINSMGPEQEGTHTCVSEEMGYRKVLAQYQLQLGNKVVGLQSKPIIWVCLMVVLIQML
ncbi:semaphorin-4C-like [Neolamprologus brichardi]|uniref:semaphorin-4C-like n=1 Tax=Neolamprologus brichardi TaxID=32507 RepID=UPI001643B432|nr:semaphorin-4C-like [Neolamprologus brichardi]